MPIGTIWQRIVIATRSIHRRFRVRILRARSDFAARPKPWHISPEEKILKRLIPKRPSNIKEIRAAIMLGSRMQKYALSGIMLAALVSFGLGAYVFAKEHVIMVPAYGGELKEGLLGAHVFGTVNPIYPTTYAGDQRLVQDLFVPIIRRADEIHVLPSDNTLPIPFLQEQPRNSDVLGRIARDMFGKNYYVMLHEGYEWTDGKPVTLEDIEKTIEMIRDPRTRSPLHGNWANVAVETIQDENENTVLQLILETADPNWGQNLLLSPVPSHIFKNIESEQIDMATYNIKPIGNTGWVFDARVQEGGSQISSYTIRRSDAETGFLAKYTYTAVQNVFTALDSLYNHSIDALFVTENNIPEEDLLPRDINVIELPEYFTESVVINRFSDTLESVEDRKIMLLSLFSLRQDEHETEHPIAKHWESAWNQALRLHGGSESFTPWDFSNNISKDTEFIMIAPLSAGNQNEWITIVNKANLAMQEAYGGEPAPHIRLLLLDSGEFGRLYGADALTYDIAIVRQTYSDETDIRTWWRGTGDNGRLSKDPIRNLQLDLFAQTGETDPETLVSSILTEWPGIVWSFQQWIFLLRDDFHVAKELTLMNKHRWKDMIWSEGSWTWR